MVCLLDIEIQEFGYSLKESHGFDHVFPFKLVRYQSFNDLGPKTDVERDGNSVELCRQK